MKENKEQLAAIIMQERAEQWRVISLAISTMMRKDIEEHGPLKDYIFNKFFDAWSQLVDMNIEVLKKVTILNEDIRECFRDKTEYDHFIWIAGMSNRQPQKLSTDISMAVFEANRKPT